MCKNNGKLEYRDTPCHFQNKPNVESKLDINAPKKSGSNIELEGIWCQASDKSNDLIEPKHWYFDSKGFVSYSSALDKTAKSITAKYSLSNDYLSIDKSELGDWFIEDYTFESLTLDNNQQSLRFLTRGKCVL
jgi:hypothetical protein